MKKIILTVLCLIVHTNVTYAKEIKLTKLKVSTAKKVKVPKLVGIENLRVELTDKHRYEEESLGSSVTYESEEFPELAVNMYIYPMDHGISAEHLMAYEFHLLKNQLNAVYEHKDFKTALLHEELLTWDDQKSFFSKHTFHDEKGALISESYLADLSLHYIKIRLSYPTHQSKKLSQVTEALARTLIQNTELSEKKKTKLQVQLSATDDETFNALAIRYQLIYALAMTNQLSEAGMVVSFDDFKEVFDRVIKISNQMLADQEDEIDTSEYITLQDLVDAEMIDEFIWKTESQPHWHKPESLKLDAFENWLKNHDGKRFAPVTGDHLLMVRYQD